MYHPGFTDEELQALAGAYDLVVAFRALTHRVMKGWDTKPPNLVTVDEYGSPTFHGIFVKDYQDVYKGLRMRTDEGYQRLEATPQEFRDALPAHKQEGFRDEYMDRLANNGPFYFSYMHASNENHYSGMLQWAILTIHEFRKYRGQSSGAWTRSGYSSTRRRQT